MKLKKIKKTLTGTNLAGMSTTREKTLEFLKTFYYNSCMEDFKIDTCN